jgi:hypothetical protein
MALSPSALRGGASAMAGRHPTEGLHAIRTKIAVQTIDAYLNTVTIAFQPGYRGRERNTQALAGSIEFAWQTMAARSHHEKQAHASTGVEPVSRSSPWLIGEGDRTQKYYSP